jgi:hypothetical protein
MQNESVNTENTWNAQKVEYLGESKTKVENILGFLSSPQMG